MAVSHFAVFLETVAIDAPFDANMPEGLVKIDINRKGRISGYTHYNVIAHRIAAEVDICARQREIRSYLEF